MRKVIEAMQSKEVYDLETCVKKNLEKMLYRIPRFDVSELSDRYVITECHRKDITLAMGI